MDSIQLWHISIVLIVLLIAAAIAGLVHFVRNNSPTQSDREGLPQQEPEA